MMFSKLSGSSKVRRILVVSLSNVGDVILTLPVVDALRAAWPEAKLLLVVGPKAQTLFDGSGRIDGIIVYDKKMTPADLWAWLLRLRRERFDLVVDLRNSMLPFLLNTRALVWPDLFVPRCHMSARHLRRLARLLDISVLFPRTAITLTAAHKDTAARLTRGWSDHIVIAPGAANPNKCWGPQNFIELVRHLQARGRHIVLVGDRHDRTVSDQIMAAVSDGVADLCGQTSLIELAAVLSGAALAVTHDSGIMHLASYLDRPVVALFGPTDPALYGPWGSRGVVVRKATDMVSIQPRDVIAEVDKML